MARNVVKQTPLMAKTPIDWCVSQLREGPWQTVPPKESLILLDLPSPAEGWLGRFAASLIAILSEPSTELVEEFVNEHGRSKESSQLVHLLCSALNAVWDAACDPDECFAATQAARAAWSFAWLMGRLEGPDAQEATMKMAVRMLNECCR